MIKDAKQEKDPFQFLVDTFTPLQLKRYSSELHGLYLALAFGIFKADEVISFVWELVGVTLQHSALHASLRNNGVLLRDVKQYAFARYASEYGVPVMPAALVTPLPVRTRNRVFDALQLKALQDYFAGHLWRGRKPLTLAEIKSITEDTLGDPELSAYAGKFIHRKMGFILKSGGRSYAELMSEVMMQAYYGLLKTYPAWTDAGHRLAIAKVNIHNRGINIIHEETAGSRRFLHGNAKVGYSAVNVSLDNFELGVGDVLLQESKVFSNLDGSVGDDGVDWETKKALQELLMCATLAPKKRLYLSLLLGIYSEDFSAWLGKSNTEMATKLPFGRYDASVRQYLGIEEAAAHGFLQSLQAHL